ncbi:MAG: S8 family peptidase [Saprospiraceae bacterium]
MEKPREILYTNLDTVEIMQWKGQSMHQYYPKLKSFMALKLGQEYASLLAFPKLVFGSQGKKYISWESDQIKEKTLALEEIAIIQEFSDQYEAANKKLIKVNGLIEEVANSALTEEQQWGELLQAALSEVSEKHIFYDGEKLVIAGWGIKESLRDKRLPFSKARRNDGEEKNRHGHPEAPLERSLQAIGEAPGHQPSDVVNSTEYSSENDQPLPAHDPPPASGEDNANSSQQNSVEGNIGQEPPENRKTSFPRPRYWWILLLLILLGILFWKRCKTAPEASNLPDAPNVIIPIDTTKLVPDEDSIGTIVSDRINIALIKPKGAIQDFAEAFKQLYPGGAYQIIYYDTLTSRLQLQVPVAERESLMKDIPEKLKQFEMLIWHESIFDRNAYPSDPGFSDKSKSWYLEAIQASGAWSKSFGDSEVIVAIIDDGFDLSHPELTGKVIKPWNVLTRSRDVFTNSKSIHGTHVAGTAVGRRNNEAGLAGIAPDCTLMPIQVADENGIISSTGVIDAVLYAVNQGAKVINLSLGLQIDPRVSSFTLGVQKDIIANSFHAEEAFWNDLFGIAEEQGVTVVLAGGNSNVLIGIDPMQRSPLAIKVSAIAPNSTKASFSNYGDFSTISAPGVGIYSSVPGQNYGYMDGTSMAAPIVAGAAALLKSVAPKLDPRQIRQILVNTGIFISNEVGPLLQLDQALEAAFSGEIPEHAGDECRDVQQKIDKLLQEIERLKQLCPDSPATDTMKMPETIEDLGFSIGRWKSTTSIHNEEGAQVTIYFDFYSNQTGKITLVEPSGLRCSADLSLRANASSFEVDQPGTASCAPAQQKEYSNYTFSCKADAKGYAVCKAQNKRERVNRFDFRLVKIQ